MSATASATVQLPELPVIHAVDIYAAQSFCLAEATPEVREAVIANADFLEAHGMSRVVKLRVINPRHGALEGVLEVHA